VPVPIFKQGISIPVTVLSISTDFNSRPAALNAEIRGDVLLSTGKITSVDVVDSGFGYNRNEQVFFLNIDKQNRILTDLANAESNTEIEELEFLLENIEQNKDGFGTAVVGLQGITEGNWISFESHINQEKVIQDSFFYQDYSYEITTSVPENVFEDTFRQLVHPSGLKFFTKFAKTDVINNSSSIESSLFVDFGEIIDISSEIETANNGFNYVVSEE
jgi:hypothetical protein